MASRNSARNSVQSAARRSVLSVRAALDSEHLSSARESVRLAVQSSYFAELDAEPETRSAETRETRETRRSVAADGIPAEFLDLQRDGRSILERTRAVSELIAQKVREATVGGTLGPALLVVMTVVVLLTYHFLSKIIFGGRPKEEQPNKFVLIALTRLLSAALYLAMSRLGLSWADCKRHLRNCKAWLICAPYALGLLAVYVTAMMALEFIALSARNAIMQSRLLLDLLIGNFLLGVPVTPQKMTGVFAIIGTVATSMLTVKQSAMSKDPFTGMLIMFVNNFISSSTYAYFPFVLPRFKVPPTICSFICAVEIFFLCSIGAYVEAVWQGIGADVLGGFQVADAVLVLAISLTDSCYFFVPILLPPIVLTLCVTSTIPCGYFLENIYFGMPFEPLTAVSMITVGLSTIAYVVSTTKSPKAAEKVEAKDAEPEAEREERRFSLSSINSSGGFCHSTPVASDQGEEEQQSWCLEKLGTGAEDQEARRRIVAAELDVATWEKLAAQLEDEELEVLSERGFQPTLLAQRRPVEAVNAEVGDIKPAGSGEDKVHLSI